MLILHRGSWEILTHQSYSIKIEYNNIDRWKIDWFINNDSSTFYLKEFLVFSSSYLQIFLSRLNRLLIFIGNYVKRREWLLDWQRNWSKSRVVLDESSVSVIRKWTMFSIVVGSQGWRVWRGNQKSLLMTRCLNSSNHKLSARLLRFYKFSKVTHT